MTYEVIILDTVKYSFNKEEFYIFKEYQIKPLTREYSSNSKISKFYENFKSSFIKKFEKNYSLDGNALVLKVKLDLNDTFEEEIKILAKENELSIHIKRPDTNNTTALWHSVLGSEGDFIKMYDESDEY